MKQALNIQIYSLADLSPHAEGLFRELVHVPAAESVGFPHVRVHGTADSFVVLATVPGVPREAIDVSVMTDRLIVRGTRALGPIGPVPLAEVLRDELHQGAFERVIKFPGEVLPATAVWTLEDGMLRFEVQRVPESDPARISGSDRGSGQ